jgi:hypothetical protein
LPFSFSRPSQLTSSSSLFSATDSTPVSKNLISFKRSISSNSYTSPDGHFNASALKVSIQQLKLKYDRNNKNLLQNTASSPVGIMKDIRRSGEETKRSDIRQEEEEEKSKKGTRSEAHETEGKMDDVQPWRFRSRKLQRSQLVSSSTKLEDDQLHLRGRKSDSGGAKELENHLRSYDGKYRVDHQELENKFKKSDLHNDVIGNRTERARIARDGGTEKIALKDDVEDGIDELYYGNVGCRLFFLLLSQTF